MMSQEDREGQLSYDTVLGLGIASLGGYSLTGSKNWLELINSTASKSNKQRIPRSDQRIHRAKVAQNRRKVFDGTTPEKETWQQYKGNTLNHSVSVEIHLPKIKVENVSDVYLRGNSWTSSDEESDDEESDNVIYQCPGLSASAEDMTVENPLFNEKLFENSYRTPELPRKYWKDVFSKSI